VGESKVVISFSHSKSSKQPFFLKFSNSRGQAPPCLTSDAHGSRITIRVQTSQNTLLDQQVKDYSDKYLVGKQVLLVTFHDMLD